jgi:hypothetical protein
MKRYMILVAVVQIGSASATAAHAQTVQLPTYEFFGAATTVVVPNQGEIAVVGRGGRIGIRDRAAFGATGRSGSRMWQGIGASAVVHDLAELDRQVLAQSARMRSTVAAPTRLTPSAAIATGSDGSSAARGDLSLREIRRLQDAASRSPADSRLNDVVTLRRR